MTSAERRSGFSSFLARRSVLRFSTSTWGAIPSGQSRLSPLPVQEGEGESGSAASIYSRRLWRPFGALMTLCRALGRALLVVVKGPASDTGDDGGPRDVSSGACFD